MMMIKLIVKYIIFILLINQSLHSKIVYPLEERQAWIELKLSYQIFNNITAEISEELRYYKNYSVLSQSLTDIGATYKFSSIFKAGLFYRYRIMNAENEIRNEIYSNFSFKIPLEGLDISDRIRFHTKFRNNKIPLYYIRNLLKIEYSFGKYFNPFLSAEAFYRLFYDKGDRLSQARYSIGFETNLSKNHQIELYFMREQEYNTDKAINANIIGFNYKLSIE